MSGPIRHDGGDCPVSPETEVVIQFRNGQLAGYSPRDGYRYQPVKAGKYRWKQGKVQSEWDIARWREARPIGEIIKPIVAEIAARVEGDA